jgi:hypothetical protein
MVLVYGLDMSGSRKDPVAGYCEHSNETSLSMKVKEFLNYNQEYQILFHGINIS